MMPRLKNQSWRQERERDQSPQKPSVHRLGQAGCNGNGEEHGKHTLGPKSRGSEDKQRYSGVEGHLNGDRPQASR